MSESNTPSGNNNNNRSNNNRNRRRRPNRNNRGPNPQNGNPQQPRPQGGQQAQSHNNGQQQNGGAQKRPNNRNNRNRNRNGQPQKPKLSHEEHAFYKYEELREAHVEARAKYFEVFDRKDVNLRNKWERLFNESLNKLRDYEAGLTSEQKEYIIKKVDGLAPDRTYTQNHQIPIEGKVEVSDDQIECPHLLRSQIESNYADDTEESIGTYEDYKSYKGL